MTTIITLVKVSCPRSGCHATQWIDTDVDARLRETHETFYCMYGHSGTYPHKTEAEKLKERLTYKDGIIADLESKLRVANTPKRKPRAKKK